MRRHRATQPWAWLLLTLQAPALLHATNKDTYDFIVIGTGPGGSSVARILSEKFSVLLLEAGEDRDNDTPVKSPAYAKIVATGKYEIEYLKLSKQLPNNVTGGDDEYIGGHLMGGSSSINGEQYVPPSKGYLEELYEYTGKDPDWKPSKIFHLLQDLERFDGPEPPTFPGRDGSLAVRYTQQEFVSPGAQKFVKAITKALGYEPIIDYTDPDTPTGPFISWQLTQYPNGRRASASVTQLSMKVRARKNLTIKTRSTVMRVLFNEDKVARSVIYTEAGDGRIAYARKEIIVSAGHYSSLILERSGVGNQDIIKPLLDAAGHPFVAHVPGVGENLGNDGLVDVFFTRNNNDKVSGNVADLYVGGAFLLPPKGFHVHKPGSPRFSQWFCYDPAPEDGYKKGKDSGPAAKDSYFQCGVILLDVSSRGFAHIQSADPLYDPLVTTNALQDEKDRKRWVTIFEEQVKPVAKALEKLDKKYKLVSPTYELFDTPYAEPGTISSGGSSGGSRQLDEFDADDFDFGPLQASGTSAGGLPSGQSSQGGGSSTAGVPPTGQSSNGGSNAGGMGGSAATSLEQYIADNYHHSHHWFGTCSIGEYSKDGVVDSSGRVHKVKHLRVADASIIPLKPDGNTQVPAYIMGHVVGYKILKEYTSKSYE